MPGEEAYASRIRARYPAVAERALDVVVGSGMNLKIFPNLMIIGNHLQVIEPLDVGRTDLIRFAMALDLPPEVNTLRMRPQENFPSFGEPDDLANFEECQAGLSIPEMEWVHVGRHMDAGAEFEGPHGLTIGPVSDELPMRVFWTEWLKRMQSKDEMRAL